jgi:hypothetical protein
MNGRGKPHGPFRTRAVALGRVKIGSLDDINEGLAFAEREPFM